MTPKWGFGVAMLPVGALGFYRVHLGRMVLPQWPLWAHLFYFVSVNNASELRRACFRQVRVARAMLPPGALFVQGRLRFIPVPSDPHAATPTFRGFRLDGQNRQSPITNVRFCSTRDYHGRYNKDPDLTGKAETGVARN